MRLDEEAQGKILDFLGDKWPQPRQCSVCKENLWTVHESVYEVRTFGKGSLTLGGLVVPLVAVECLSCGNTHFFNAIRIGVVPKGGGEGKVE